MAAAVTVGATPLSAGDLNEALVEVFPAAPVVSVSPIGLDWTGGHGGLSLGMLSAQGRGTSDNGYIYGLHGGYVYDFGTVVVGGEFEFLTGNDFDLGGIGLEYRVNDTLSVDGEALAHSFDDVGGTGDDVDAQAFSLRTTFRF